jgi:hypothetical protein
LEPLLANKWAPEEMLDHVLDKYLGWVKSQVDSALEKQQPAAIKLCVSDSLVALFAARPFLSHPVVRTDLCLEAEKM